MAPGAAAQFDTAALQARQALQGKAGPMALVTNAKVFGIACFACLGGLLYGYNQGVFSGVLAMNNFNAHMGVWTKDQTNKGWLTSILELGAWVGTIYSGFLAEIFSRKYAILMNTVVFIIGVVIQATAVTSAGHSSILAGRFITGMGVGSLSMIVPMYNAECAPPEVRGALVGLQQLAITTVPFSPRWLEHHGREAEARKTLASLRGLSQDHELIELEYAEIKAQSLFEKRTVAEHFPALADGSVSSTIKLQFVAVASLFKSKPMLRRVGLATVTMFFQQWTGINAILYYAPQIFQGLGLGGNTISLLATGVVGIVMWLATFPAVMYVDKIGRKPILVSGAIGMGVCHLIVAGIMASFQHDWPAHVGAGWAAVVMVWIFVIFFGYSWGPCAWIIIAEIWPISQRPYGIALGPSSNWMNNFIVGQVTPDMFTGITYGTFILFGLLIMMGGAFIWFFFPETKGLSLEEMDVLFGSVGVAAADAERMREINREVGLDNAVRHGSIAAGIEKGGLDEKADRMDSE
ncbi:hypothetical protein LTR12_005026 [Friedmanniomyces endolithicus]|nr:hypothetical protein LTR12_005026 [Friedmanniomyces endolithicus]